MFNDAGLSFVVWPPTTGRPASDAPPQPPAVSPAEYPTCASDPIKDRDLPDPLDHTCLADSDTVPVSNPASSSNRSTVGTAVADDAVGVEGSMSRGYLLALKLWEEAVATVNAAQGSNAELRPLGLDGYNCTYD